MMNTNRHRRTRLVLVVVALLATVAVPSTPTAAAQARESSFDCDFNGDGDADYAIGVPNEDLPGKRDVGVVEVLYGNWDAGGTKAAATLTLGRDGVAGDRMGTTILCQQFGFTGDGAGALVVGIPHRTVNGRASAGEVRVYYGFSDADPDTLGFCAPVDIETAGCTNRTSTRVFQVFRQGAGGVPGTAQENDRFGWDFAWGNFNRDGFVDLAIGIPGEDVGRVQNAGAVQILFGSPEGLVVPPGGGLIVEGSGAAGSPESDAAFGFSLAAGDIFGDAATDLVIGAPNSRVRGQISAGTVHVVTMREGGGIVGGREFSQAITGDPVEAGDFFGGTVSVGQFDGSGKEDVAVGAPLEDVRRRIDVGQVHVLRSGSSLRSWRTLRPPRRFGANAFFGSTLWLVDHQETGIDGLIVGSPGATVARRANAGAVQVFAGGPGPRFGRGAIITIASFGTGLAPNAGDCFGSSISGYRRLDLPNPEIAANDIVVGAPQRDVNGVVDAGLVMFARIDSAGRLVDVNLESEGYDPVDVAVASQNELSTLPAGQRAERGDRFGSLSTPAFLDPCRP